MSNQYEVLGKAPGAEDLKKLSSDNIHLTIKNLSAGYGKMEILHNLDLFVSRAQSLCLIGPNGAGKSTILHSIYGFTNIFSGQIEIDGKEITNLSPAQKLKSEGKPVSEGWSKKWDCANKNHKIFTMYAEEGNAAVSTYLKEHLNYQFSTLIMSYKRPKPGEKDYAQVFLHEYFHVYQHAHVSDRCSDDQRKKCERSKLNNKQRCRDRN